MSEENQMGLFGEFVPAPAAAAATPEPPPAAAEKAKRATPAAIRKPRKMTKPQAPKVVAAPRKVSGLVPEGDVRLTANIRQELHLKLKITSAYRRTTIGEIIEELVEKYL